MPGLIVIAKKEFLDHISSRKFLLIFGTLLIIVLVSAIQGAETFTSSPESGVVNLSTALTQMVNNISTVGGILAVALSFDVINREKVSGSLKVLLSYPIYRDTVLIGKFLGGLGVMIIVAVTAFITGVGTFVAITGVPLSPDSGLRLLLFLGMSILYLTLFLGIGLLFSIVFSEPSTSLLGAMIFWLASSFLIPNLAFTISTIVYPPTFGRQGIGAGMGATSPGGQGTPTIIRFGEQAQFLTRLISSISPSESFRTAVTTILTTSRIQFIPTQSGQGSRSITTIPISLQQATLTALPNIIYLLALLCMVFAVCYIRFTREEIR
ncbi:MAG: ABC transporter permease subunit [Candidatus Bathyarchaeia archaeon]